MKIILDYSWHNPIPNFNPTHMRIRNNRVFLIRFGKSVPSEVIRKLNFEIITKQRIFKLDSVEDIYRKDVSITGGSESFIFEITGNRIKARWYVGSLSAPLADRVEDFEYLNSEVR